MRVLVFDPSNRAPMYLEHFTNALRTQAEVTVVSPPRVDVPSCNGCFNVTGTVWRSVKRVGAYTHAWLEVMRRACKVDIVHIQWLSGLERSSVELALTRWLLRRNPCLAYTVHNLLPHGMSQSRPIRQRFRALYHMMPLLFVHSERTRRQLADQFGVPPKKVCVVPHGPFLITNASEDSGPPEFAMAMVGRMSRYKGVEDAVDALGLLLHKRPEARLLLAGRFDPDYKKEVLEYARRRGVRNAITVVDRQLTDAELVKLHGKTAVAVFPYREISQSGAVLTAVGLGIPIVCYDVGGLSDVVQPGVNGFVVRPGDTSALADRVAEVLHRRTEFMDGARLVREKASWNHTVKLTMAAYMGLLGHELPPSRGA